MTETIPPGMAANSYDAMPYPANAQTESHPDRLATLAARETALDHHFALYTLFEIMDVSSRADLKADLLKELERHRTRLLAFRGNPQIDEAPLAEALARIDRAYEPLNAMAGKAGQALTANEWLMSVRSRAVIPGGTCEFDLPAYYAWQHKAAAIRHRDLAAWTSTVKPLSQSVGMLLNMLRDSGTPQKVVAPAGQFQQNLPQGRTFQLLRLRIDPDLDLIPEISGNRLLVSVRLMRLAEDTRLHASNADTMFELTLCS